MIGTQPDQRQAPEPVGGPGETLPLAKPNLASRINRMSEARFGLLLLLPAALILIVMNFLPILYAAKTSFQKVNLTVSLSKPWVGFDNYRLVLNDSLVWDSFVRTIQFAVVTIVVGTLVAGITALTLNEQFPGRSLARVLLLLPWAIASMVTGVMWNYLFNTKFGVINAALLKLGIIDEYINWLGESRNALIIAGVATAWKMVPFLALLMLASLQSIPESLYRSAKMDGANVWHRFRQITLPHMRTVLAVVIVYQVVGALLSFDLIYGFTKGGPGYGTTVLNYLIYIEAFERLRLGVASAMSMLMTVLILVVSGASVFAIGGGRKKQ
ncbi:sugar ABC transporter permease [soil metagenome]